MLLRRGSKTVLPADAVFVASGVAIAAFLAALNPLLNLHRLQPYPISMAMIAIAWIISILSPAVAAAWAALITMRDVRGDLHQLMKLSSLSRQTVFEVRLWMALYRLRLLIVTAVGLTPALMIGTLYLTRRWTLPPYPFFSPFPLVLRYTSFRMVVWRLDTIGWAPEFYGWALGTCAAIILGAALGVALALRWQTGEVAALVSGLVMLTSAVVTVIPIPLLPLDQAAGGFRIIFGVLAAVWPLIALRGLLGLARRWV
jgi:hypothetical protein